MRGAYARAHDIPCARSICPRTRCSLCAVHLPAHTIPVRGGHARLCRVSPVPGVHASTRAFIYTSPEGSHCRAPHISCARSSRQRRFHLLARCTVPHTELFPVRGRRSDPQQSPALKLSFGPTLSRTTRTYHILLARPVPFFTAPHYCSISFSSSFLLDLSGQVSHQVRLRDIFGEDLPRRLRSEVKESNPHLRHSIRRLLPGHKTTRRPRRQERHKISHRRGLHPRTAEAIKVSRKDTRRCLEDLAQVRSPVGLRRRHWPRNFRRPPKGSRRGRHRRIQRSERLGHQRSHPLRTRRVFHQHVRSHRSHPSLGTRPQGWRLPSRPEGRPLRHLGHRQTRQASQTARISKQNAPPRSHSLRYKVRPLPSPSDRRSWRPVRSPTLQLLGPSRSKALHHLFPSRPRS